MTTIIITNGRGHRERHRFATYRHALQWLSRGTRAERTLAIETRGEP